MYFIADTIKPIAIALTTYFKDSGELEVKTENIKDINFIWYESKNSPGYVAKIAKLPEYVTCLGVKPLLMICYKPYFDSVNENMHKAIVFHELMHISFNEKGSYKLIDHTLKDFSLLIKKLGLNYEKADEVFSQIKIGE